MDGKKKLEELASSVKGHPDLTTRFISAGDIRSISAAYKAMEGENERMRLAIEFAAKMCWRTDPLNAANALSDGERLSAIKFHPTIKKYGEPHEQLRVAESEARHEG